LLSSGRAVGEILSRVAFTGIHFPSPPFRGEREGPSAKRWEGEVGIGERSGIPHLTLPSPPPRAERE